VTRRLLPFDAYRRRHTFCFGDEPREVALSDADVAQLHDTLLRLHSVPDPPVTELRAALRRLLDDDEAQTKLQLGLAEARQVQLAVYAEQAAGRPTSAALTEARLQAFGYIESYRA
jgi:hypothetical protein